MTVKVCINRVLLITICANLLNDVGTFVLFILRIKFNPSMTNTVTVSRASIAQWVERLPHTVSGSMKGSSFEPHLAQLGCHASHQR